MRIGDVDLDACRIRIAQGKAGKDRTVPFPAHFKETLALHISAARRRGAAFLFASSWKKPYSTRGVRAMLAHYAAKAGLPHNIPTACGTSCSPGSSPKASTTPSSSPTPATPVASRWRSTLASPPCRPGPGWPCSAATPPSRWCLPYGGIPHPLKTDEDGRIWPSRLIFSAIGANVSGLQPTGGGDGGSGCPAQGLRRPDVHPCDDRPASGHHGGVRDGHGATDRLQRPGPGQAERRQGRTGRRVLGRQPPRAALPPGDRGGRLQRRGRDGDADDQEGWPDRGQAVRAARPRRDRHVPVHDRAAVGGGAVPGGLRRHVRGGAAAGDRGHPPRRGAQADRRRLLRRRGQDRLPAQRRRQGAAGT
ncbi:tyrosine-type recombinase/integrase [Nonomuraea sp. 3-1Str]|uniref:tyrosine-type recombinase/integrase n=1 Tax=Nonomuraea sp. 3-1Str TaxID=2929801 RepID=UPI0037CAE473